MSDEPNTLTGSEEPATATTDKPAEVEAKTEDATEAKTSDTDQSGDAKPGEGDDAKEVKPKQKSRAQDRIEQLSRERRSLFRQLSRANQQIGQLRAEKLPNEGDFADHSEFTSASFKRASRETNLEQTTQNVRTELDQLAEKRKEAWGDIVAEARQQMPDFETVFTDDVPVSEAMADLIMEAENPAQLAYFLGKNRSEARRIASMSPVEAAREIGRMEARLSPPKAKQISSAPKPVSTVTGKAHASGKSVEDMSYDEYKAHRLAQIKAKAAGG